MFLSLWVVGCGFEGGWIAGMMHHMVHRHRRVAVMSPKKSAGALAIKVFYLGLHDPMLGEGGSCLLDRLARCRITRSV